MIFYYSNIKNAMPNSFDKTPIYTPHLIRYDLLNSYVIDEALVKRNIL